METILETTDHQRVRRWNGAYPPGTCVDLLERPQRRGISALHLPAKPCNTVGSAFVDATGVSVVRVEGEPEPVSLLRCRIPTQATPEWSKETARRRYLRICNNSRGGIYFALVGKWFAACGFKGGARISVSSLHPGKLRIELAENAAEPGRLLTVSYGNANHFPFIFISGVWLEDAGFKIRDTVRVEPIAPGLMEITVDPSCADQVGASENEIMRDLPGDPGLPPGCSERDFAESEPCQKCDASAFLNFSDCCGATLDSDARETMTCPECRGDCCLAMCDRCHGTGQEPSKAERYQQYLEDKADER